MLTSLSQSFKSVFRKYLFKIHAKLDYSDKLLIADAGPERYVVNTSDTIISKRLFSKGNFDFDKFEKSIEILGCHGRSISTLVDIGAHIGPICIPAITRGFCNMAIAIEPEPRNFSLLMANIWLNDLQDSIKTQNVALGANDYETVDFELSEDNYGDHRVTVQKTPGKFKEEHRKVIQVPSCRLDTLLQEYQLDSPLIWMDTQGYEGVVLEGAQAQIMQKTPIVLEFWPYGIDRSGCFESITKALKNYSYFYDLRCRTPKRIQLTEDSLENFYKRVKAKNDERDILVV